jgi:Raf kinase inhibitor-like YbhB/YbcL family protein
MDDNLNNSLNLTSPAFTDRGEIPKQYTCKGDNVNPPLNITSAPQGTKSLALILHDPDAIGRDFTHWLVWDIPSETKSIAANSVPIGAIQGLNDNTDNSYMGPCPPAGSGTHRYIFEVYALDVTLNLPPPTNRKELEDALKAHILASNALTGLVAA